MIRARDPATSATGMPAVLTLPAPVKTEDAVAEALAEGATTSEVGTAEELTATELLGALGAWVGIRGADVVDALEEVTVST